MQSNANLIFISTGFRLDRKGNRRFPIFNFGIYDRFCLIAKRIAGLRLLEFYDGNNVASLSFINLFEFFPLKHMERPKSFNFVLCRIINTRIIGDIAGHNFHHVDPPGKRVGYCSENIGREGLIV